MENQVLLPEVTFQHHQTDEEFKKKIRKTTILLSVITLPAAENNLSEGTEVAGILR